jgi:hypothetical protein
MTFFRSLVLVLIAAAAPIARGGQIFVWSGDDSRFAASFTITDAAFNARQFSYSDVTSYSFAFNDPTHSNSAWHLTTSDLSLLGPNTFDGTISLDGTGLSNAPLPTSPGVSFWVSSWPVAYSVGVYSYGVPNSATEIIKYSDYNHDVYAQSSGAWSHQSAPPARNVSDDGSIAVVLAIALAALTFGAPMRRRFAVAREAAIRR